MTGRGEEFRGWTKVHSFSYNGIVKTCNMETKKECEGGEVFKDFFCYYGERKEGVDNG